MHRWQTRALTGFLFGVLGTAGLTVSAAEWLVTLPEAADVGPDARLLLLLEPYQGRDKPRLSANSVYPGEMTVAGMNVAGSKAGTTLRFDTFDQAAPQSPHALAGDYLVQAFLDTDDRYNFDQGGPGDWYSAVQKLTLPLQDDARFTLSERIPDSELWAFAGQTEQDANRRNETRRHLHEFTLDSRLLSAFHGRPVTMRAWVLLPDDYETRPDQR